MMTHRESTNGSKHGQPARGCVVAACGMPRKVHHSHRTAHTVERLDDESLNRCRSSILIRKIPWLTRLGAVSRWPCHARRAQAPADLQCCCPDPQMHAPGQQTAAEMPAGPASCRATSRGTSLTCTGRDAPHHPAAYKSVNMICWSSKTWPDAFLFLQVDFAHSVSYTPTVEEANAAQSGTDRMFV